MILLNHIRTQCEVLNKRMITLANSNAEKADSYIELFKYPCATYLTCDMFENLRVLLDRLSLNLRDKKKTMDNLPD